MSTDTHDDFGPDPLNYCDEHDCFADDDRPCAHFNYGLPYDDGPVPHDDRACRDNGYILPDDTGRHIANYDHLARVHRPDATLQHLDTR